MPKSSSICPAVSIQFRLVTKWRTDGRTHDDSKYRASITSGGKKFHQVVTIPLCSCCNTTKTIFLHQQFRSLSRSSAEIYLSHRGCRGRSLQCDAPLPCFDNLYSLTGIRNRQQTRGKQTELTWLVLLVSCHQQGHAGSKTLHRLNPPVLNWRCRLTQVDLYNGRKTVVVVVGQCDLECMLPLLQLFVCGNDKRPCDCVRGPDWALGRCVCVPVCLGISLQQRSNEPTFGLRYILHVGYNHCRHCNHLKISSITMWTHVHYSSENSIL